MDTGMAWVEARSIPVTETGCFLWLGAEKGNGYGNVHRRGRNMTAHRRAYEEAVGPVPDGIDVCHKCDTRLCINPAHLFLGTRLDNMRDAVAKGRQARGRILIKLRSGELGSAAKLTWGDVGEIRRRLELGESTAALADAYGVTADNIRKIRSGETWKE